MNRGGFGECELDLLLAPLSERHSQSGNFLIALLKVMVWELGTDEQ